MLNRFNNELRQTTSPRLTKSQMRGFYPLNYCHPTTASTLDISHGQEKGGRKSHWDHQPQSHQIQTLNVVN